MATSTAAVKEIIEQTPTNKTAENGNSSDNIYMYKNKNGYRKNQPITNKTCVERINFYSDPGRRTKAGAQRTAAPGLLILGFLPFYKDFKFQTKKIVRS